MKPIITLLVLAALVLVVASIACRTLRGAAPESTLVAGEMEQAYGNDWAVRLIAAGETNREFYLEMVTAYYEAVDANAEVGTVSTNWAGHQYILGNRPSRRTSH